MKLFSIINTFDKKEWTGFLTYVELYHKPKSTVYQVAQWLDSSSLWKQRWKESSTAEKLLSSSNLNIKVQTFSNVLTTLGNIAEEYVGWNVWKNSKPRRLACQLEGLAKKSLTDEYLKTQKEVLAESQNDKISIWDDFYKMRTLFEDYNFQIRPFENNYVDIFDQIINYFNKATASLAQFIIVEVKNRERLLSEKRNEELRTLYQVASIETNVKNISDKLININECDSEDDYSKLIKILKSKEIENYSKYIQYFITAYTIIYLTRKIKQGETHRGQELLDIYDYSLNKGFFTLNDYMSLQQFNNIIGVASKLNRYQWARTKVTEWAYKVDKSNGRTISVFGNANIDFYEKKYDKVVKALAQMKPSNFQHRFTSRWLNLKAQYELNKEYVDMVKTQVDNFRRFIISNNKSINKQTLEGLKCTLKIMNMTLDRKDKELIERFYIKSKYVFERKWILEKIKNPA